MRHRIRRTYTVRQVEVFDVSLPDDIDPQHLIAEHYDEFSTDLSGGLYDATLVTSKIEPLEYDELHLEVIDRESARVIPMRKRENRG
jgi:hypothetical protein